MTTKSQEKQSKVAEVDENISRIYDFKKRLGKGAYGIVWKALDKRTNQTVAVKKIFDAFRDETDAQRTFREIVFLKAFRNHTNVVSILNVYKATNNLDIYLIFEYMESDLHNIIKKGSILKDVHKRYVMYQLINAVRFIHSGNVIHRDLKPSNILIDNKCRCKLADFGLARSVATQCHNSNTDIPSCNNAEILLTDYVATRWYRAPEILVASKRYTKGIDMWSLGCILGEMLRGKPLFQGSSTVNQIEKIVTALPNITEEEIAAIGGGFGTALLNKQTSAERGPTLDELLKDSPPDAFQLVKSLLLLDPLARLTANEAISHAYVQKFRNSSDEIELNVDILPPFSDDIRLTVQEYREKVYEMSQMSPNRNSTNRLNGKIYSQNNKSKDSSKRLDSLGKGKCDILPSRPSSNGNIPSTNNGVPTISLPQVKSSSSVHQNLSNKFKKSGSSISKEKISNLTLSQNHTESQEIKLPNQSYNYSNKPLSMKTKTSSLSATKNNNNKSVKSNTNFSKDREMDKFQQNIPSKLVAMKSDLQNEPVKVESLGSLDGGYGSLSSESNGKNLMKISTPKGNTYKKSYEKSSNIHLSREKTSSKSLIKNDISPSDKRNQHNSKGSNESNATFGYNHLEGYRSVPSVSSSLLHKATPLRCTKSDQLAGMTTKKTNASICYEKRLKKLEEEIEKYKIDVNSFCKQTCRVGIKKTGSDVHNESSLGQNVPIQKHKKQIVYSNSGNSHIKSKLPTMTSDVSMKINSSIISGSLNGQSASMNNANNHNYHTYEYKHDVMTHTKNGSGDYITRPYNYIPIKDSIKQVQKQHYHESSNNYSKFRYQYQQAGRPVSVSKLI